MAKEAILKTDEGTILYPRTISSVVLDAETGEPIGKVYAKSINGRLLVTEGDKRYFANLTELYKPEAPHIATTTYSVVTGSAEITVENKEPGSEMFYSYDTGEDKAWSDIANNTLYYDTKYSTGSKNDPIKFTIYLKATLHGEDSDVKEFEINITPKVASGSVTVERKNDWSTQATIKFTPSPTVGATSKYGNDTDGWTEFNTATSVTVYSSKNANAYIVNATKADYVPADAVGSPQFTLNAKKAYYGSSSSGTMSTEEQVTALGNSLEAYHFGGKTLTLTLAEPAYVWLCCTKTIKYNQIGNKEGSNSGPDRIPFKSSVKVGDYNCYRSTSQWVAGSHTVWIPS